MYRLRPAGTLTEPLARCDLGGADLGLAALRSGLVALSGTGTASRALLQAISLEDSYIKAEDAARLERRGLWWDYPSRGGGDAIAWRIRQDAQAASAGALAVSVQAWIAQVLVLAGGVVAFLFERGREAALVRGRQTRLLNTLRRRIDEVKTAASVGDWTAAEATAAAVRTTLLTEGLSPHVLERWEDVVRQVQGRQNIDVVKTYTDTFERFLKEDPALGLIA